jgi:hypothetical protein
MSKRIGAGSGLRLPAAVLLLGLVCGCSEPAADPRADLEADLQGELDVEGYLFTLSEDEDRTTTALTNPAVRDLVTLDQEDAELPLRYTRIQDQGEQPPRTYRSAVLKDGPSLSLVVAEVGTNAVISTTTFPTAGPACFEETEFASLQACIARFNCVNKGALLCEANRTCEPQLAAVTCCLENDQIFSVHLIYPPTSIRCRFKDLVPELEGLVLSRG